LDPFRDLPLVDRILLGALAGGCLGVAFLGIGLARFLVFLLLGGSAAGPTWSDLPLMAGYVAALGIGGAIVGAVRPLLSTRRRGYATAALVGACVMLILGLMFLETTAAPPVEWAVLAVVGMVFGLAFAWGFDRV